MTKTNEYIVNADGWCAGQRVKKGQGVQMTEAQAKYENVTLAAKPTPKKDK